MLFAPIRAGTLSCVNAFGSGVGDDKLMHAYVEKMVRFYLAEPLLGSVRTYDVGVPDVLGSVLDRIKELVHQTAGRVRRRRRRRGSARGRPGTSEISPPSCRRIEAYVAQETIMLCATQPPRAAGSSRGTSTSGPFVLLTGDTARVIPGRPHARRA